MKQIYQVGASQSNNNHQLTQQDSVVSIQQVLKSLRSIVPSIAEQESETKSKLPFKLKPSNIRAGEDPILD